MKTSINAKCSITLGAVKIVPSIFAFALFVLTPASLATSPTTKINMYSSADKRQSQSISEDWHQADAVCIGNLRNSNATSGATLVVTETLKGDSKLTGTTLPIPLERHLAGIFPTDSNEKPALVFFSKSGTSSCAQETSNDRHTTSINAHATSDDAHHLVATEIYNDADKMSATRCLAPIFDSMSEKQSLQALSDMVLNPSSRCNASFRKDARLIFKRELLAALNRMRDKNNFSVVTRLYEKCDADTKHELLDWMACTGDRRALPYLIAAVPSPDRSLRSTAVTRLAYYYPGDAGVDNCIEQAYEHGFADIKNAALDYLSKRRKNNSKATTAHAKTLYQQAEELHGQGKFKEATALYVQEILKDSKDGYVRRWSALKALPHATAEQKTEIRKSILPLVTEDAATGNYLEATDAADILQKLRDEECLDAMIKLLDRIEPLFSKANRMAAFGIAQLSQGARHKATLHLLNTIKSDQFKQQSDQQKQLTPLLELAWIADAKDLQSVDETLANSAAASVWKSLHPLVSQNDKNKNGTFLLEVLKNKPSMPHLAIDWVIVKLGELKESRAADLILAHLKDMKYQYDGNIADDALKSIGGVHVCQELEKLAFSSDEVSRNALDILCAIEQEKSLPTLRKILTSKSGAKTNALTALARIGAPEDLIELIPFSDYWKGDRKYHYWAMEAVASIRQRYNYTVSGPIAKAQAGSSI